MKILYEDILKKSEDLGVEVFEPCEENDCRWLCRLK